MQDQSHVPLWRTKTGIIMCGFLAIAAFFLLTEHTAHVLGILPWLLILACPLMHLFHHHGHGGHRDGGASSTMPARDVGTGRVETRHGP